MPSLVEKVASVVPREVGERVLCAAYVPGSRSSAGAAVIAVSDRHLYVAPRAAFLSRGAWRARPLGDVRIEPTSRGMLGLGPARGFEIFEDDASALVFELETRKEAQEFRRAFGPRLAPRAAGR
jgi:hypothetical protein